MLGARLPGAAADAAVPCRRQHFVGGAREEGAAAGADVEAAALAASIATLCRGKETQRA